jgi:GTP-binding protein HflX
VAAFRATLEEVQEADLVLHVRDISDSATASQRADVNAVLADLGIDPEEEPDRILEVWNKADLLDPDALEHARNDAARHGAILVSAVSGLGLDDLLAEIETRLNRRRQTLEIVVQPQEGALSNWIYENCEVISRADLGEGAVTLRIRVAPEKRDKLARVAGASRLQTAAE